MRVLALDIGEKRIGVASGNTQTRIATPLCVMPANEVLQNAPSWRRTLEDHEPEMLVFGLPKSLNGAAGKQARRVSDMAESIARACALEFEFIDERLSSAEAKRRMHEMGMTERDMRGNVDACAAAIFLETWLEMRAARQER